MSTSGILHVIFTYSPGRKLGALVMCVVEPLQKFVLSTLYPGKGFHSAISTVWECTHCMHVLLPYLRYAHVQVQKFFKGKISVSIRNSEKRTKQATDLQYNTLPHPLWCVTLQRSTLMTIAIAINMSVLCCSVASGAFCRVNLTVDELQIKVK